MCDATMCFIANLHLGLIIYYRNLQLRIVKYLPFDDAWLFNCPTRLFESILVFFVTAGLRARSHPSAPENLTFCIFLIEAVASSLLPIVATLPLLQLEAPEAELAPQERRRVDAVGVEGIHRADGGGIAEH